MRSSVAVAFVLCTLALPCAAVQMDYTRGGRHDIAGPAELAFASNISMQGVPHTTPSPFDPVLGALAQLGRTAVDAAASLVNTANSALGGSSTANSRNTRDAH